MPANKRKLIIVGIVLVGVALAASVIFVTSHHFSKVVLDENGDGRKDVIVEPYAVDGDGDGVSVALEEGDAAPDVSFEERKAVVEGVKCAAPKDPTSNFDGRWYDESGRGYTPDEIEAMDLTRNMVFYSVPMDE